MFNERLKMLRKKRGLTQNDVALKVNVERSSVAKYEGPQGIMPSTEVLIRLADLFDVTLDYLLGRDCSEKPEFSDNIIMLSYDGKRILRRIPAEKMPVLFEIVETLADK